MKQQEEKGVSPFTYVMGGFVLGAVCGLLLAPKKGSVLLEDITDWGRDKKERGQALYSRIKGYLPHREPRSIAEGDDATRAYGGQEYSGIKEKMDDSRGYRS